MDSLGNTLRLEESCILKDGEPFGTIDTNGLADGYNQFACLRRYAWNNGNLNTDSRY